MKRKAETASSPKRKRADISKDSEDLGDTELVDSNPALEGDSSEDNDEYDYDNEILLNVEDDVVYEKVVIT